MVEEVEVQEEIYYTCKKCGFTSAKKEVKNCPVINDTIVLVSEID